MQQQPERTGSGCTMPRRALLACGILSSLVYVAADILGALSWNGYRYASQAISELSAIGAPSRPVVLPLAIAYSLVVIGFGFSVYAAAGRSRGLRVAGAALVAVGAIGLVTSLWFPMHLRGAERGLSDGMHIVPTAATVLCILLAVGSAASALGKAFRRYSSVTLLVLLLFGGLAARDGAGLAANLPTPMLGINERINVGAYLLWVAALAVALLRAERTGARLSAVVPLRN
jgi:hypothetical protein